MSNKRHEPRENRARAIGDEVNDLLGKLGARFKIEDLPERLPEPPMPVPRPRRELVAERARLLHDRDWPRRALDVCMECDERRDAIVRMGNWRDRSNIAVLSGPVGTGKTVAAAWWALHAPYVTRFIRATTLARTSRYSDEWAAIVDSDALCIDDLGVEYSDNKGSFAVDIDELIGTYHEDMRPLIITTNCSYDEFCNRYGERNHDRLHASGNWITLTGPSLRRRRP